LDELVLLASRVSHPLRLFMIGGMTAIPTLAPAYSNLTYIDTSAFMGALHRQRLYLGNDGLIKKRTELTEVDRPVDALLSANAEIMRQRVAVLINASQLKTASSAGTEQPQGSPETGPSEPSAPSLGRAAAR
jgi:hypothetical protein